MAGFGFRKQYNLLATCRLSLNFSHLIRQTCEGNNPCLSLFRWLTERQTELKIADGRKKNNFVQQHWGNKTFHIAFADIKRREERKRAQAMKLSECVCYSTATTNKFQFFFCVVCSSISHLFILRRFFFSFFILLGKNFRFSSKFRMSNRATHRAREKEKISNDKTK